LINTIKILDAIINHFFNNDRKVGEKRKSPRFHIIHLPRLSHRVGVHTTSCGSDREYGRGTVYQDKTNREYSTILPFQAARKKTDLNNQPNFLKLSSSRRTALWPSDNANK
jgi:hypothetical protein